MRLPRTPKLKLPDSAMADTAFLLIIFFMITSTMSARKGLDWQMGKEDQGEPVHATRLEVLPGGSIQFKNQHYNIQDVAFASALQNHAQTSQSPIWLDLDRKVAYGQFISVLDELTQTRKIYPQLEIVLPSKDQISWIQ